jgi:hypothetical protein
MSRKNADPFLIRGPRMLGVAHRKNATWLPAQVLHSPPERALQDSDAILGRQTVQPCARNAFWYVNGLPFFGIAQVRSLATRTQTVPSASACPCADLELIIGPGQSR